MLDPNIFSFDMSYEQMVSCDGFHYRYDIYTRGPSAIDTAEVVITWPLYTSDDMDEYLLYIYENAEIITQPECKLSPLYYFSLLANVSSN